MISRTLHALPWAASIPEEPTDLPESMQEDMLIVTPINSAMLYATWQISYQTRNRLLELLGEEKLSQSRLILVLEPVSGNVPERERDVSGPARSCYINFECRSSESDIFLRGLLGYRDKDNNFYMIAKSDLAMMLPSRMPQAADEGKEVYGRILRRIAPGHANSLSDLSRIAAGIDEQFGRNPMPLERKLQ
ncbi:MAG: DUF4912 domain-containing protein [bacterium]|nr:DUF4912 domain-containing protein [bacterium]